MRAVRAIITMPALRMADDDALAHMPVVHLGADFCDDASAFMSEDARHSGRPMMTMQRRVIGATNARRFEPDFDVPWTKRHGLHIVADVVSANRFNDERAHFQSPRSGRSRMGGRYNHLRMTRKSQRLGLVPCFRRS